VAYHTELLSLAESLGLKSQTNKTIISALAAPADTPVLFLLSIPNSVKQTLLNSARLLAYTPSNEHFGIVPLEAMLSGLPVLAANTGGPKETVLDGQTGWLRDPGDVGAWSKVMEKALGMNATEGRKMGNAGKKRVKQNFSRERMAERLDRIMDELENLQRKPPILSAVLNFAVILATFALGIWVSRMYASAHPPKGQPRAA
jgi:alpha-1,3/alpha-1,6-mannosyltransferase